MSCYNTFNALHTQMHARMRTHTHTQSHIRHVHNHKKYCDLGTHHSPFRCAQYRSSRAVGRSRCRRSVSMESVGKHSITAVRFLGDHGILSSGVDG